jgi:glycosyltransferase involved in cell wall biosynthesis
MNYPKISIVTPNFNGDAFLEATILSVLGQNYPNLEYIIIDGGSSDNSVEIIKKYQNQLSYWVSEPDKGLYDAVQKGFYKSSGEIMAWINSDDLYHDKSFFSVAEIFCRFEQVNWLQGIPTVFDEKGKTVHVGTLKRWRKLDFYLGDYKWIQQESIFWRRRLWDMSGGDIKTEMKYAGDFELWLRFFRHEKLYATTALIAGFRQCSKGQLSSLFYDEYIEEAENTLKEELDFNLSKEERILLDSIRTHNHITQRIKLNFLVKSLNKLFYSGIIKQKKANYGYPQIISFDRLSQSFKINV